MLCSFSVAAFASSIVALCVVCMSASFSDAIVTSLRSSLVVEYGSAMMEVRTAE